MLLLVLSCQHQSLADVAPKAPLSVQKARVWGRWGNCYTSLDFQEEKRGVCRGRNWVVCRCGRRRLPHPPVLLSLPPLRGWPSGRYQKLADSSPKARFAGVGGLEGRQPFLMPSAKLPSRCALRGRPGTRWALPQSAAPRPPPPAPGSLLPTPTPATLSRPSPTTEPICYPPAAHVGRGLMLQPPEITQTPLRLLPPRSLCAQGHGPRPGSKPPALSSQFRGGGRDQSAEGKVEVGVTTAKGGAEMAQGAGV